MCRTISSCIYRQDMPLTHRCMQGNHSIGGQAGKAGRTDWSDWLGGRLGGLWSPCLSVFLAEVCGGRAELGLGLRPRVLALPDHLHHHLGMFPLPLCGLPCSAAILQRSCRSHWLLSPGAVCAAVLTAICPAVKSLLEHTQWCQNARHKQLFGGTIWRNLVPARIAAQCGSFCRLFHASQLHAHVSPLGCGHHAN